MRSIVSIVLGCHQARQAVSHLLTHALDQIGGPRQGVGAVILGLNQQQGVIMDHTQIHCLDSVPHRTEVLAIKRPVIQFGDQPVIRKPKDQAIYVHGLHHDSPAAIGASASMP